MNAVVSCRPLRLDPTRRRLKSGMRQGAGNPPRFPPLAAPGNSLLTLAQSGAHDAPDNFQRREDVDKRTTQRAIIAQRLSEDGMISSHDMLLGYGISRTAARIAELRAIGWVIRTERKHNEMADYYLVER